MHATVMGEELTRMAVRCEERLDMTTVLYQALASELGSVVYTVAETKVINVLMQTGSPVKFCDNVAIMSMAVTEGVHYEEPRWAMHSQTWQ